MQKITTKDVILYTTMPRVVPRIKSFFASGFSHVAVLMAQIYAMVRLLPAGHPYLQGRNIGRFGVIDVLTEASRNITFSRKNIDQILIYTAILMAAVTLVAQFVILAYTFLISPAMATSIFVTPGSVEKDIAFNMLDRVFGVPQIFCNTGGCTEYFTNVMDPNADDITPYHAALHDMFEMYSRALLLLGMLIFLYFLVVVIFETATSGTPFGQRFQNVWVPIRLVVAIGLLVPVKYGLNSGQYVVLYTAKFASGLATNAWNGYNEAVSGHSLISGGTVSYSNPLGEGYTSVVVPSAPPSEILVQTMSLVHACAYAYHRLNGGETGDLKENKTLNDGTDYPEWRANYADPSANEGQYQVQPYLVKNTEGFMTDGAIGSTGITGEDDTYLWIQNTGDVTYEEALGFYFLGDIIIRFGERKLINGDEDAPEYTNELGNVKPLCGDVRLPVLSGLELGTDLGPDAMLKFYYDTILTMWFSDENMRQYARGMVDHVVTTDAKRKKEVCEEDEASGGERLIGNTTAKGFWASSEDCQTKPPTQEWKVAATKYYNDDTTAGMRVKLVSAWAEYVQDTTNLSMDSTISERGWAGAGIWFNKIAEVNGGWMDGVRSVPYMNRYPLIMEEVRDYVRQHVNSITPAEVFDPSTISNSAEDAADKIKTKRGSGEVEAIAKPLSEIYKYWNAGEITDVTGQDARSENNAFKDAVNLLLGANGLFDLREANFHIHPLAQLIGVGKGLVNSAIYNIAGASATSFLGGIAGALGKRTTAGVLNAMSGMFNAVAFIGLTAGFVLYYVLPFLPFLYFFFAMASWVKTIFEAMVGVPLWALAHLRIDGEGLPGEAAQNGYFLILEIFVRPILTLVGLVAAIAIFSAQVRVLSMIWGLVTSNLSGFNASNEILTSTITGDEFFNRGKIDGFFFLILYTVIVYMLALASFKLIDKIPDNILRWAGAGVSSFGDIDQNQIEGLNRYVVSGGMTIGSQASGAISQAAGGTGGVLGNQIGQFMSSGGRGQGGVPASQAELGVSNPASSAPSRPPTGPGPKGQGKT